MNRKVRVFKNITIAICLTFCISFLLQSCSNTSEIESFLSQGDYATAITYYQEDIDKGNTRHENEYKLLNAYIQGEKAFDNDDLKQLNQYLVLLLESNCKYPTKTEIKQLQNKYETRKIELDTFDKQIQENSDTFKDADNID